MSCKKWTEGDLCGRNHYGIKGGRSPSVQTVIFLKDQTLITHDNTFLIFCQEIMCDILT